MTDRTHGSPYDRGRADNYYRRAPRPHKWLNRTGSMKVIALTDAEITEYHAGYDDNDRDGDHKDWN